MIVTVFDTETTGLLSSGLLDLDKQPEIIELMAVKLNLDTKETIEEYEFLVKPSKPISHEITEITGITNEMVEHENPFSYYPLIVKDALENTEAVIAHNLSFDKEMIDIEMQRCNYKMNWPRPYISVEANSFFKCRDAIKK